MKSDYRIFTDIISKFTQDARKAHNHFEVWYKYHINIDLSKTKICISSSCHANNVN